MDHRPWSVRSLIRRSQLDPNRDVQQAAQGFQPAIGAWETYQQFVLWAKRNISVAVPAALAPSYQPSSPAGGAASVRGLRLSSGLLLDMHGHGHAFQATELGYMLTSSRLESPDAAVDADPSRFANSSSVRFGASASPLQFSSLLRGNNASLGAWIQEPVQGIDGNTYRFVSIPGPTHPDPGGGSYFSGGYLTGRWGSRAGPGRASGRDGEVGDAAGGPNVIDSVQVEMPSFVRSTNDSVRGAFAHVLAKAAIKYMALHHGVDLLDPAWMAWRAGCVLPSPSPSASPTQSVPPSEQPASTSPIPRQTAHPSPRAAPTTGPGSGNSTGHGHEDDRDSGSSDTQGLELSDGAWAGIAVGLVAGCALVTGIVVVLACPGTCSRGDSAFGSASVGPLRGGQAVGTGDGYVKDTDPAFVENNKHLASAV